MWRWSKSLTALSRRYRRRQPIVTLPPPAAYRRDTAAAAAAAAMNSPEAVEISGVPLRPAGGLRPCSLARVPAVHDRPQIPSPQIPPLAECAGRRCRNPAPALPPLKQSMVHKKNCDPEMASGVNSLAYTAAHCGAAMGACPGSHCG